MHSSGLQAAVAVGKGEVEKLPQLGIMAVATGWVISYCIYKSTSLTTFFRVKVS